MDNTSKGTQACTSHPCSHAIYGKHTGRAPWRALVVLAYGQAVGHAELVLVAGLPEHALVDHHQVHVAAALGNAAQHLPQDKRKEEIAAPAQTVALAAILMT